MKKVFKILSFLFLFSFTTYGQVDKEYGKTLKKMFEVSGSEDSYQVVIQQMFSMFKQQHPDFEEEIWNEFSKTSINELTEMLVPIYSKYLTKEELKELIKFYETPVGKKFSKNAPFIIKN